MGLKNTPQNSWGGWRRLKAGAKILPIAAGTVFALALIAALGAVGVTLLTPSGEQSKLVYEGDLWCVSNYIEEEPQEIMPDGRPRKDRRLDSRMDWIRREQVSASSKEEAEEKVAAMYGDFFAPSEKERLRQALDEGDKSFFTHHFNTGATSPGPCWGSGEAGVHTGLWVKDAMREECYDLPPPTASGSCEMRSEQVTLKSWGTITLPKEGRIVEESHLATKEEGFWPANLTDRLDRHIQITHEAIGRSYDRVSGKWTPAEGGGKIGQGSGARPPAAVEPWVMNMYWATKPPEGTRVIIKSPKSGKAVVAAAGYEIGPGGTRFLLGAQSEVMRELGVSTGSTVEVGFAKDQNLPFGPIECASPGRANGDIARERSSPTIVVIDPGHGSAANKREREDKMMLEIGLKLSQELKNSGYEVVMTRTSDGEAIGGVRSGENADNIARASIVNNAKPAIAIRLHSDSSRSDDYFWVLYPDRKGKDRTGKEGPASEIVIPKSKEFAQILKSSLESNQYQGIVKGEGEYTAPGKADLLILSAHSRYPVVTLEIFGNQNDSLMKKYSGSAEQTKLARAFVQAVKQFASPPPTAPSTATSQPPAGGEPSPARSEYCPPATEPPPPGPSDGDDYREQIAREFQRQLSRATGIGSGEDDEYTSEDVTAPPGSALRIAQIARNEVGQEERRGENRVKYNNGDESEWCAYFATWVIRKAGFSIPHMGGSLQTYDWFKKNQQVFSDPSQAEPGDVVVWRRPGAGKGHIAIVVSNDREKSAMVLANGNSGRGDKDDRVKILDRTYDQIKKGHDGLVGFGRFKGGGSSD